MMEGKISIRRNILSKLVPQVEKPFWVIHCKYKLILNKFLYYTFYLKGEVENEINYLPSSSYLGYLFFKIIFQIDF